MRRALDWIIVALLVVLFGKWWIEGDPELATLAVIAFAHRVRIMALENRA